MGSPAHARPEATIEGGGLPWGRFLVVFLLVALDQWSKTEVFAWLHDGGARRASTELVLETPPAAGETVTVGERTYVFRAKVGTGAGEVATGTSAAEARRNLVAAVNGTGRPGEQYGRGTRPHRRVEAVPGEGAEILFRARVPGVSGNRIEVAETLGGAGNALATPTLHGGRDKVVVRDDHGPYHERYPLLGRHLAFMTSENAGAAFGRFSDWPHLLVGGRILAVGVLVWLLFRASRRHPVTFAAMVLVLAGALGNLLDNLFFGMVNDDHPYRLVRDFIDVWFVSEAWGWDWHFPTFNVADSCISVGAVGWVLAGLFHREPPAGAPEEPEPAAASDEEGGGLAAKDPGAAPEADIPGA